MPCLLLSFAVWMVWSVVVAKLPAVGFPFTNEQFFWLAALPGPSGATLRAFYSFMPAMFGVALSAAVLTLALYSSSTLVPQATDIVVAVLMFFSIGFVPLDQYPKWLQPFVEHQPVSYTIKAMRGLSIEGPIARPMLFAVLWSVGILAICAVPLALGYRKASRRG